MARPEAGCALQPTSSASESPTGPLKVMVRAFVAVGVKAVSVVGKTRLRFESFATVSANCAASGTSARGHFRRYRGTRF